MKHWSKSILSIPLRATWRNLACVQVQCNCAERSQIQKLYNFLFIKLFRHIHCNFWELASSTVFNLIGKSWNIFKLWFLIFNIYWNFEQKLLLYIYSMWYLLVNLSTFLALSMPFSQHILPELLGLRIEQKISFTASALLAVANVIYEFESDLTLICSVATTNTNMSQNNMASGCDVNAKCSFPIQMLFKH